MAGGPGTDKGITRKPALSGRFLCPWSSRGNSVEVLRRYSKLSIISITSQTRQPEQQRSPTKPPHRVHRRLTSAAIQQLCADYQGGCTTRDLASRYGISKASVTALLRERSIPVRCQGVSDEQVQQAVWTYEAGSSVAQVARTLGLPPSSIYDALRRAGVVMRDRHDRRL
jgi:hypothetical protein